jgi:hypothetical protein
MPNTTNKTKKTPINIEWPEGHFTIDEMWQKVGGVAVIPAITLRFRLKKAEADNKLVAIGKIKPVIGRPKLVYTKANPSKAVLDAAKAAGVLELVDKKSTVSVGDVTSDKKKAVVPATATVAATASTVSEHTPTV